MRKLRYKALNNLLKVTDLGVEVRQAAHDLAHPPVLLFTLVHCNRVSRSNCK